MSTIKELRDLLEKATPGEWEVFDFPLVIGVTSPSTNIAHCSGDSMGREQGANASLIAASRNTLPALLDLIEEMAGALNEISTSKHQAYTDGHYISDHDSGYKMGVADGHRYCANVAGKALAAYEKMKGE